MVLAAEDQRGIARGLAEEIRFPGPHSLFADDPNGGATAVERLRITASLDRRSVHSATVHSRSLTLSKRPSARLRARQEFGIARDAPMRTICTLTFAVVALVVANFSAAGRAEARVSCSHHYGCIEGKYARRPIAGMSCRNATSKRAGRRYHFFCSTA